MLGEEAKVKEEALNRSSFVRINFFLFFMKASEENGRSRVRPGRLSFWQKDETSSDWQKPICLAKNWTFPRSRRMVLEVTDLSSNTHILYNTNLTMFHLAGSFFWSGTSKGYLVQMWDGWYNYGASRPTYRLVLDKTFYIRKFNINSILRTIST